MCPAHPRSQVRHPRASTCRGPGREHGIALILVLWLVVLLSVIAASHAYNVHVATQLTSNQVERAKARALAEAGVNRAVLEVMLPQAAPHWPFDGSANTLTLDGGTAEVSVRNVTGLVDLNTASADLLAAVLGSLQVEPDTVDALVDAIQDWRDLDDLKRLHGAEADDYRHAGLLFGPKNRPFDSVDELRYVMGMRPEWYQRLRPFLTVYSHQKTVSAQFAPEALLLLLPGADPVQIQSYVEQRHSGPDGRPPLGLTPPAGIGLLGGGRSTIYHVTVKATRPGGTLVVVEADVALRHSAGGPGYAILCWREA